MKSLILLACLLALPAVAEETFTHNTLYCTNAKAQPFSLVFSKQGGLTISNSANGQGNLFVDNGTGVRHSSSQDVYSIDGWGDGDTDFFYLIAPRSLSANKSATVTLHEDSDQYGSSSLSYTCHPLE